MLTIYKASAGSGKTYNLTGDYIRYLLAEKREDGSYRLVANPRKRQSNILAITFTNKATAEMSARIVKALYDLSRPVDDYINKVTYARMFTEEFGCTPDQLQQAAAAALKSVLFDYSYFNVSTIDAFFQSVLRAFTREVEIPDNFDLDLDSSRIITMGLSDLLNSINQSSDASSLRAVSDEWVVRSLKEFMELKMLDGRSFNLFSSSSRLYSDLAKEFEDLVDEKFRQNINVIREYYSDPKRIVRFRNRIITITNDRLNALKLASADFISAVDESTCNSNFIKRVRQWSNRDVSGKWAGYLDTLLYDPLGIFRAESRRKGIPPEAANAVALLSKAFSAYNQCNSTLKPIVSNILKLGLLGRILEAVDKYCRENNMVLLSETNNILKGLINDDETPFIYEKLGYYINHYLIDEFQDTSAMQWENLKPLILESLSRGEDNLIIGDEKQSIYRFRNAKPELLGKIVAEDVVSNSRWVHATIKSRGVTLADNSNWRSSREVVLFNNTLFHFLPRLLDHVVPGSTPGHAPITDVYRNVIQQIDADRVKSLPSGYVRIEFSDDEEQVYNFIEEQLRRLLGEGRYRPADIAILTRKNNVSAAIIRRLMAAMNRPDNPLPRFSILSNDAMRLGNSEAVKMIVSILKLVNLPEFMEKDEKRDSGVETEKERKLSDAYRRSKLFNRFHYYLHNIPHNDPDTENRVIDAINAAIEFIDKQSVEASVEEYRSLLGRECLTLPGIVERIIARHIPPVLRDEEAIYLVAFQDALIDYTSRFGHDIRKFVKWWDTTGARMCVSSPGDLDAVKVMTIHQSKGLEFPCVIIPYVKPRNSNATDVEWLELDRKALSDEFDIDPDIIPEFTPVEMSGVLGKSDILKPFYTDYIVRNLIDELNVFYVAFTRASRELLFCAVSSEKSDSLLICDNLRHVLPDVTEVSLNDPSSGLSEINRNWVMPLAPHISGSTFSFGKPTVKVEKDKEKKDNEVNRISINHYTLLSPGADTKLSDPDAKPVLRAKVDEVDPFDPANPRHLGDFLHRVMSCVTTPDRLPAVLKRMFYKYRMPLPLRPSITRRLEMALSDPGAARWFSGFKRVVTERSLTCSDGGEIEFYRPDRVVFFDDGHAEVVDYKFVNNLSDDPWTDRKYRKYRDQVMNYADMLSRAKDIPVNGYLWFITDSETRILKVI